MAFLPLAFACHFCWVLFRRAGLFRELLRCFSAMSGGSSPTAASAWALSLLLLFQTSAGDTGPYWGAVGLCSVWGWSGPCSSSSLPSPIWCPLLDVCTSLV